MNVLWLFLTVPWVYLHCLIVKFSDHTHLLLVFNSTLIKGDKSFKSSYLHENFPVYTKDAFFVKETDTFDHNVVLTTYTSPIDHFTPQHTAFEQPAVCL